MSKKPSSPARPARRQAATSEPTYRSFPGWQAAEAWIAEAFAGWEISDSDLDEVIDYLHGGHSLNPALRDLAEGRISSLPSWQQRQVDLLDRLIARTTVPENVVAVRFWGARGTEELRDLQPGDIFTHAGFTSTSLSDQWDFPRVGGARTRIRVPAGSNAIAPNVVDGGTGSIVPYHYVAELLLPRNTKFRVISRPADPLGGDWELEVVNG